MHHHYTLLLLLPPPSIDPATSEILLRRSFGFTIEIATNRSRLWTIDSSSHCTEFVLGESIESGTAGDMTPHHRSVLDNRRHTAEQRLICVSHLNVKAIMSGDYENCDSVPDKAFCGGHGIC